MSDSAVRTSSARSNRHEACTVVSVMPYMFTSWVRSPTAEYQRSTRLRSNASPANSTYRMCSVASGRAARAGSMTVSADGVWLSTVTRSRAHSSANSSGSQVVSRGTTTSFPPCSRHPNISYMDTSNEQAWNRVHTSSGPRPYPSAVASSRLSTLRWVTRTPLGRPVEPEV